jgi:hypothetical protein
VRENAKFRSNESVRAANVLMPEAAGAIVCRICLDHEDTPSNPLLRPCRCRGSMAYVHRNCLNEWRRQSIHPNSIYQCDTCKFEYRFATAIGPDRFTIARVLAWPITIHLLSVMALLLSVFWVCFAGGFVAKLFDASLTWSDFNLKSCFNINHLLRGATAIGATVYWLLLKCYWSVIYCFALCFVLGCIALIICAIGGIFLLVYNCLYDWIRELILGLTRGRTCGPTRGRARGPSEELSRKTVRLSAREAAAGEAGARAAAAAQHVVLDVGGHDDDEDGEASGGSFDGGEDKEHGNVNAPHPLERQQLIARP